MQKGGTSNHAHSSSASDGGGLGSSTLVNTDNLIQILAYRRPVVQFTSISTVTVENNTGTASQTAIIFPDWDYRTDSTAGHRIFDITRNAVLSGASQSGLRTSLSEAVNTWYALYAVKVTDNTTDFVIVGDTTLPIQANVATLNSNFGTNGWVYLGMIRNGDNSGITGDILDFTQTGNTTLFKNTAAALCMGTVLATATNTNTQYTYSAGTGATGVPNHLTSLLICAYNGVETGSMHVADVGGTRIYSRVHQAGLAEVVRIVMPAAEGTSITNTAGGSVQKFIFMAGFFDAVLAEGINPLV